MTPEERAEKMAREYANGLSGHEWTDADESAIARDIAAKIQTAIDETYVNAQWPKRMAEIRASAFEECAKIAETEMGEHGYGLNGDEMAAKIRAAGKDKS